MNLLTDISRRLEAIKFLMRSRSKFTPGLFKIKAFPLCHHVSQKEERKQIKTFHRLFLLPLSLSKKLSLDRAMARGTSQSQASSGAGAGGTRPATVGPRGSAAATAGMRRRRTGSSAGFSSGASGGGNNMLRFYTDDAPGVKMSPTVVLVMSLCFIGFVTALHVFGKLYRYRSAASGGA
ncbi:hypothetical protein LUZ60_011084 [Juncus effusus]|nr:hypothetical protein LUZ60_011084 [Juncus effusus]